MTETPSTAAVCGMCGGIGVISVYFRHGLQEQDCLACDGTGGEPEPLTNDQRLTMLSWALRSVVVYDEGNPVTIWEKLTGAGVPLDRLLGDALPLSSPPYGQAEMERMLRMRLNGG